MLTKKGKKVNDVLTNSYYNSKFQPLVIWYSISNLVFLKPIINQCEDKDDERKEI